MAKNDRENVQSGLDDLLGNVIRTDRQNSGRESRVEESSVPYDNNTSHNAITQSDNLTITQSDIMTDVHPDKHSDNKAGKSASKQRSPKTTPNLLQPRLEEAAEMAESQTMTVTLRIPAAMNEWLDEYVHRSWPQKIKKQELVIEALQLLFVRRGRPGDEILESDLLPEKRRSGRGG